VRASVSYVLTAGVDVETLCTANDSGVAPINLTGNSSGNVVRGNNGANVINGGAGKDYLFGRGGPDVFAFDTPLDPTFNVDVIGDFSVPDDIVQLDDAVFPGLTPGRLAASQFVIAPAAQDADDRIVYNSQSGALLFDADGTGGAAAVPFANIGAGLALSIQDFLVV
jgi:Ca2+-binding RTX toxin-like protein